MIKYAPCNVVFRFAETSASSGFVANRSQAYFSVIAAVRTTWTASTTASGRSEGMS